MNRRSFLKQAIIGIGSVSLGIGFSPIKEEPKKLLGLPIVEKACDIPGIPYYFNNIKFVSINRKPRELDNDFRKRVNYAMALNRKTAIIPTQTKTVKTWVKNDL